MVIEFDDENLEELYKEGKTKSKNNKYRFQKSIIKQYKKTIDKLYGANTLSTLYKIQSLNYEQLKGDLKEYESVRVNDKYRIIFKSRTEGTETIMLICKIFELSKHYE